MRPDFENFRRRDLYETNPSLARQKRADTKASKEYEKFKVKQDKNYISDFDKLTMKSKKINDKK